MAFLYLSLSRFMTNLAKARSNSIPRLNNKPRPMMDLMPKTKWPTFGPPTISHLDPSPMTLFPLSNLNNNETNI